MKITIKIFLLFFQFLLGCNFFGTRPAEEPNTSGTAFQPATTIKQLIINFQNSLEDKNSVNYLKCLADSNFSDKSFQFIPSASAISQFPSLTDNWDLKHEETYFRNMMSKVPDNNLIRLNIFNDASIQFTDSLIYSASYTLTVPLTDATIPQDYQGDLKFTLIRDSFSSVWVIYNWQDFKNSDLPSWSDLKGRFY